MAGPCRCLGGGGRPRGGTGCGRPRRPGAEGHRGLRAPGSRRPAGPDAQAPRGPQRAGARGRRVQAGQEPAGERAGQRARLPGRRRRRHGRAHRRAARRHRPQVDAGPRGARQRLARAHRGAGGRARRSTCSEAGNPGNKACSAYAEIGLPRKLLEGGLVLVDTPGVGGLGSAHGAATMSALPSADAVLLVSDAAQEYTGPELEFLGAAMKLCPNVACVVTKTDLYPHWRRIMELDRGHLARRRDPRRRVPRLVHAAAARREDAGRRTDGRVGLPAAGRLPAAPRGGGRPTSWTAAPPARTCWPSASSSPRGCRPSWPCRRTPSSSSRCWPSSPGEGARRRAQAALGALADHVERRGRRPLVRHRLRPARPAAHDHRARPNSCSTTPTRPRSGTSSPTGSTSRWPSAASANFVWAVRAGALPVRAGGAALRGGGRDRAAGPAVRPVHGASRRRSTRWRNRTPRASASARRSSRACAAATAACS